MCPNGEQDKGDKKNRHPINELSDAQKRGHIFKAIQGRTKWLC